MASRAAAVLLVALLGAAVAIPAGAGSQGLTLKKAKKKFYTKQLAQELFLTQQEADALYGGDEGQRLIWSEPPDPDQLPASWTEFDSLTLPAGNWLVQATMNFDMNAPEEGQVVGKPICRLVDPADTELAVAPGWAQSVGGPFISAAMQALVTTAGQVEIRLQCEDPAGTTAGSRVSQIRIAATSFEAQDVTQG